MMHDWRVTQVALTSFRTLMLDWVAWFPSTFSKGPLCLRCLTCKMEIKIADPQKTVRWECVTICWVIGIVARRKPFASGSCPCCYVAIRSDDPCLDLSLLSCWSPPFPRPLLSWPVLHLETSFFLFTVPPLLFRVPTLGIFSFLGHRY